MGLSTHRRPRFHLGLLIVAALCGAAVCDPATEKIERFEKWFSENGGTHGGFVLKPENTPNRSRGQWVVLATTDIHEDDVLFRVPLSSVIWMGTMSQLPNEPFRRLLSKRKYKEGHMEIFLLHEMAAGNSSKWWPYLQMLPSYIPLAWRFSPVELEALQDDSVVKDARSRQKSVRTLYDRLRQDLVSVLSFGGGLSAQEVAQWSSFDSFQWACSIITSRTLSLRGDAFLVPYADMIGYSPSKAYREAAGGGHFLRHHRLVRSPTAAPPSTSTRSDTLLNDPSATTVFEVIADQDVLIGNEVSEDFGDASNYVYIHHHGFLPPYNPFDCVDIPLPTMMNRPVGLQYADALSSFSAWIASWASPAVDKRELFASQEQYNALLNVLQFKPGSVPVACLRVEPLPRDIRHLFQVRYASSHLVETCLEKVKQQPGRKSSPGFDEIEELRSKCLDHVPMPTAAWEELASIAQAVLDAFPTTEENDSQLLRLGSLPCKKMGPAKAGASSGLTPDGAAEVCNPLFFQLTNNEILALKFRISKKRLLRELIDYYLSVIQTDRSRELPASPSVADGNTGLKKGFACAIVNPGWCTALDLTQDASSPRSYCCNQWALAGKDGVETAYKAYLGHAVETGNLWLSSSASLLVFRSEAKLTLAPCPNVDSAFTDQCVSMLASHTIIAGDHVASISLDAVIDASIAVRSFPLNIGGVTDALSSAFACSTGSECLHSNSIASRTARLQALYLHLIQQTMFAPANLTEQLPSASVVSSISAVRKLRALAFMLLPPPAMMQSSLALREEEWSVLKMSQSFDQLRDDVVNVEKDFGILKRNVLDPFSFLFPREVFTLESYKWAVQTVRSRGLWWDDEPHIAPLLDIGLFSWNVAPIGAQLSPNSAAAVTSTANGSWIALKSPRKSTFAIGRGELVVFPLLDNRHMLYGQHGFADVPIALPTHHKSQPGNLSDGLAALQLIPRLSWGHLSDGDCVFTRLLVHIDHPDAKSQLATLRQYDHYTHDVEACVPPTVLLTEVEENLSPDVLRMLNFVKAVTGVHHSGSAKKCLARILASRFHLWVNANATKVVTTEPQSLAHAAARRYVVSELALLRTAWERELRFMTPVHSDASLQALLEMDITTVSGTQDGRGQVFSGRRISPSDPTSVCVSCADFLPEVQTVYL